MVGPFYMSESVCSNYCLIEKANILRHYLGSDFVIYIWLAFIHPILPNIVILIAKANITFVREEPAK